MRVNHWSPYLWGPRLIWETMSTVTRLTRAERFHVPVTEKAHRRRIARRVDGRIRVGRGARGIEARLRGAGGAAHCGARSSFCVVPVLGVPVRARRCKGLDSLLSIVQMLRSSPSGTEAIGGAGATNAGLSACSYFSNSRPELREKWCAF